MCISLQGRVYITRHIIFDHLDFPYSSFLSSVSNSPSIINSSQIPISVQGTVNGPSLIPIAAEQSGLITNFSFSEHYTNPHILQSPESQSPSTSSSSSTRYALPNTIVPSSPTSSSSTKYALPSTATNHHPVVTRRKAGITKPNPLFAGSVTATVLPKYVTEALQNPIWYDAMKIEFNALKKNSTWTLVPASPHMNIVGCKWVFRTKYKVNGTLDKHEARLVAKGFHQTPGIDYLDTFSSLIKPSIVRLTLTLAISLHWYVHQLDINNAFLNGILQEKVFMSQPEGFIDPSNPTHVCKLNKALYGLKQAPRAWFDRLKFTLLS